MSSSERLQESVLILRSQVGDRAAIAELVNRYRRPLHYFITHLSENAQMAEDVFQDTWLSVIRKIHTLKHSDSFPSWLYRIARNRVYQHFREKKRPVELHENVLVADELPENVFSAEEAALIHKSLKELPPEQREVLLLRFMEQMPYQQIAEVLGCNLNTIKTRIFYAKLALKKKMEG